MVKTDTIDSIAEDFFSFLAHRFPVCCWSDEFVFFPQALSRDPDWRVWDDFSPDSVQDTVSTLSSLKVRLEKVIAGAQGLDDGISQSASLLFWVKDVLLEQLAYVRTHLLQPTFYLTQVSVGLAQALETGEKDVLSDRISTLPEFLDRSFSFLGPVPDLFRRSGLDMAAELLRWIPSFGKTVGIKEVMNSVEACRQRLQGGPSGEDFRLEEDLLERVVRHHTGSGFSIRECLEELEEEIQDSLGILEKESRRLGCGSDWKSAFSLVPGDPVPDGGKKDLLLEEIRRLRNHCRQLGIHDLEPAGEASLSVELSPPSLLAIRTADSYSARPGFPFRGGVFYLFEGSGIGRAGRSIHPEYRVTAAHEAYPGHHLLDLCRWNGPYPVRRPIEYPLFYEGWACFGEDLMLETGAFDRPWDRLIVAKRRYAHAVRGQADLLLHRGDLDCQGAARRLCEAGFSEDRALATARKYSLRPAYQLCYTIGRRHFQALYDSRKELDRGLFARIVLKEGEILLEDLGRVMEKRRKKGKEGREKKKD